MWPDLHVQLYCILLFVTGVCIFGTIISETNAVLEEFKVLSWLSVPVVRPSIASG
jgi:hypothetical protein